MHTSFISEHTAELILVPQIIQILHPIYGKITPFYYWATREGGLMSRNSFAGHLVKLIAVYPRRPKVIHPGLGQIQVKLNDLLFYRSRYFQNKGVPVFAGVPLADSFEDILLGTECVWLELNPVNSETLIEINLQTKQVVGFSDKVLQPEDILELANSAQVSTWPEALQKIRDLGRDSEIEYRGWNRMSGDLYKPIYLVLHISP